METNGLTPWNDSDLDFSSEILSADEEDQDMQIESFKSTIRETPDYHYKEVPIENPCKKEIECIVLTDSDDEVQEDTQCSTRLSIDPNKGTNLEFFSESSKGEQNYAHKISQEIINSALNESPPKLICTSEDTEEDELDESLYKNFFGSILKGLRITNQSNNQPASQSLLMRRLHSVLQDPERSRILGNLINTESVEDIVEAKSGSQEKEELNAHFFTGVDKTYDHICKKLRPIIRGAKERVLICVYSITLTGMLDIKTLEEIKDKCFIITDQRQMYSNFMEKYTKKIHELGIPIKYNCIGKNLMHCKFIVADNTLIFGSMNMGKKSLMNYEHISVTSNKKAIRKFSNRFDRLWHSSDFIAYKPTDQEDDDSDLEMDLACEEEL
ncbi:unnamed protein product [Moneuplotes crassus]|uniref:Mitochondrial cardiolipin hydrolase n=1 Tax=Euplotes crassus TaxID=5936 RepID=A0AAD1U6J8_EUPCR|nr:unnamed protein product [Moneuplotes crassus]